MGGGGGKFIIVDRGGGGGARVVDIVLMEGGGGMAVVGGRCASGGFSCCGTFGPIRSLSSDGLENIRIKNIGPRCVFTVYSLLICSLLCSGLLLT